MADEKFISRYLACTLDRGWLSPDGWFYGCKPGAHQTLIEDGLMIPWHMIESERWIMISDLKTNPRFPAWSFVSDKEGWVVDTKFLTEAQKKVLEKLGIEPKEVYIRNTKIRFEDLYPNEYVDHPGPRFSLKEYVANLSRPQADGPIP